MEPERPKCPRMARCPIFPEFKNRSALRMLQVLYCESEFTRCRRYQSIEGGVVPPSNLLPDGRTLPAAT
jgi:hypothetical protein